ncbi:hypothetical protein AOLI_G00076230 [Acnodon oligacanthus]
MFHHALSRPASHQLHLTRLEKCVLWKLWDVCSGVQCLPSALGASWRDGGRERKSTAILTSALLEKGLKSPGGPSETHFHMFLSLLWSPADHSLTFKNI